MINPIAVSSWIDPLDYVDTHDCGEQFALLYSSMQSQGSGRYSYLATHPDRTITASHFAPLEMAMKQSPDTRWVGYLGYGLRHDIENVTPDLPSPIDLPELWMFDPKHLITWDHDTQTQDHLLPRSASKASDERAPEIIELSSNMTKDEYLSIVKDTLHHIQIGNFYQANITRKFMGRFKNSIRPFNIFRRLCAISPAPFSAYMQHGDTAILSSSPEGFLTITPEGEITTRPIKGSAPRHNDPARDQQILLQLEQSHKDRAENLMIVDLMRNDLSRCAEAGSVSVSSLFDIHSYATIHQMVSTIQAKRAVGRSNLEVIKACFPAGSMTGAPKIHAMNWCAEQEKLARGVYSGAIGWVSGAQGCDLSVVIRTLIIQGDRFEFQVGGGIVADSQPENEWEETLVKATAIAQALAIPMEALKAL